MSMRPDLLGELLPLLSRDYGLAEAKGEAGWLRKGTCPACHKKELYAKADAPWVLRCGRMAKCGAEFRVQELYPDLFEDWSKRAAKQAQEDKAAGKPENPTGAADLYLSEGRGFDLRLIKGWYTQESRYEAEADNGKGAGSKTVRFAVHTTWWERIIDRPHRFSSKAKFGTGGEYKGYAWVPPSLVLSEVHRLWITEGIFNAIALLQNGIAAVSAMSCNNYPGEFLKALRQAHSERGTECVLVWALDGDKAGREYTQRWADKSRADGWTVEAAQIPQKGRSKQDWNDLHQLERLGEKDLAEYLHHGALLIAKSATEKALLIYRHSGGKKTEFQVEHRNRWYWFKLDLDKFNKAVQSLEKEDRLTEEELREEAIKQSHTVRQIANCLPVPLYFQENEITGESWYFFRISFPHDGAPVKNTFPAGSLISESEFNKRLLSCGSGAMFSGSTQVLKQMMGDLLFNLPSVKTIDFLGYSREYGAYLLGDLAIKEGKVFEINEDDFFEIGGRSLKIRGAGLSLDINTDLQQYSDEWFPLLWRCYGAKGLLTLTFWIGSLFAEQIRATQKIYPFFELVGEPGAGKSTLIEFLWRLTGRFDYEGFDPSKATPSARGRNFSQVSNLPVVLIEGDRDAGKEKLHSKSFDWEELKPFLGGKGMRARGMLTSGNEINEPPFRGAIFISQNAQVDGSKAILSRIVHVTVDTSGHTAETKPMAEALERMPMERISGFMLKVLKKEREILDSLEANRLACEDEIAAKEGISTVRIIKTHGQMLALARCLPMVLPISDEQLRALELQIYECARERQESMNSDHPTVVKFWETFDFLDSGNYPLNHARDPDNVIAVNLNHFQQGCREKGQETPNLDELKKLLPSSRRHKYITQKAINSRLKAESEIVASTTSWCWVFERGGKRR